MPEYFYFSVFKLIHFLRAQTHFFFDVIKSFGLRDLRYHFSRLNFCSLLKMIDHKIMIIILFQ